MSRHTVALPHIPALPHIEWVTARAVTYPARGSPQSAKPNGVAPTDAYDPAQDERLRIQYLDRQMMVYV